MMAEKRTLRQNGFFNTRANTLSKHKIVPTYKMSHFAPAPPKGLMTLPIHLVSLSRRRMFSECFSFSKSSR